MKKSVQEIKQAISAIEGMKAMYDSLQYADSALTALAGLESSKARLETDKASLEKDVDNLSLFKQGLIEEIEDLKLSLEKELQSNQVKSAMDLEAGIALVKQEVENHKEKMLAEISDLSDQKDSADKALDEIMDAIEQKGRDYEDLCSMEKEAEDRLASLKAESEAIKQKLVKMSNI